MATAYDCKFIETSVGICHNVDELLVGLLTQIRLKLENPEKSRFVHVYSRKCHYFTLCACFVFSHFLFNVWYYFCCFFLRQIHRCTISRFFLLDLLLFLLQQWIWIKHITKSVIQKICSTFNYVSHSSTNHMLIDKYTSVVLRYSEF